MSFPIRVRRLAKDRQAGKLDFSVLTAALAAQRALGDAGHGLDNPAVPPPEEEALVELVLAGPRWRQAASMQQGCFSRAEAGRRNNDL